MSLKNPYKAGGMFEGANPIIFEFAKQLRKNMTAAEMNLWLHVRKGINGCKFRRQHPIGVYIADFYCHKEKLFVEVDGSVYNKPGVKEADKVKQDELESMGYHVIRFTNKQVMEKPEDVLEAIREKVANLIK